MGHCELQATLTFAIEFMGREDSIFMSIMHMTMVSKLSDIRTTTGGLAAAVRVG